MKPLTVRVVQKTDVGRVRTENQDFAILSSNEDEQKSGGAKGRLMVVADGMGGHRGGATASRLAATTIKSEYYDSPVEQLPLALKKALQTANSKIYSEAQSNPELRGMGTTCSALVIKENKAFFAHVGDSRIYLVRGGEIRQLTDDHSLVASMVREGLITSKEAEVHPRRNVLQRSMGVSSEVEVDVRPELQVAPGDTFILCSDGLHGLVHEEEMLEVAKLGIEEAATEFVNRALDRGAPDNVTVIVARVEGDRDADAPVLPMPGPMTEEERLYGADTEKMLVVNEQSSTPTMRMAPIVIPDPEANVPTEKMPVGEELLGKTPTLKMAPITLDDVAAASSSAATAVADAALDERPRRTEEIDMDDTLPGVSSEESTSPPASAAAVIEPPPFMATAAPKAASVAASEPSRHEAKPSSAMKWVVIILLFIGAAGAVFYAWSNAKRGSSPTSSVSPGQ